MVFPMRQLPAWLRWGGLCLLFSLPSVGGRTLPAADAKNGPVYTDPAQTDEDFPFQGEYRGYQAPLRTLRSAEPVGLQVVALGNGEFQAVKFYGGLPGAGWKDGRRYPLQGARTGGLVELRGEEYDVVVDGTRGLILNRRGESVGELWKLERVSPTLGAPPPPGAIVLFDGTSTAQFINGRITPEGHLLAGAETTGAWSDFLLHGEFRLPYKPLAREQARGNSGFYLQRRYEVQVLDSFGLEGVENECGALYRARRPDVNMCLPPLQWQTYDIEFHAPRFDAAGQKVCDMRITVWHNGVLIHDDAPIPNKTGGGKAEGPEPLPLLLQDHGNPVVYRNLWLVDLSDPQAATTARLPVPPRSLPPAPISVHPPHPYPQPLATVAGGRWRVGVGGP